MPRGEDDFAGLVVGFAGEDQGVVARFAAFEVVTRAVQFRVTMPGGMSCGSTSVAWSSSSTSITKSSAAKTPTAGGFVAAAVFHRA